MEAHHGRSRLSLGVDISRGGFVFIRFLFGVHSRDGCEAIRLARFPCRSFLGLAEVHQGLHVICADHARHDIQLALMTDREEYAGNGHEVGREHRRGHRLDLGVAGLQPLPFGLLEIAELVSVFEGVDWSVIASNSSCTSSGRSAASG